MESLTGKMIGKFQKVAHIYDPEKVPDDVVTVLGGDPHQLAEKRAMFNATIGQSHHATTSMTDRASKATSKSEVIVEIAKLSGLKKSDTKALKSQSKKIQNLEKQVLQAKEEATKVRDPLITMQSLAKVERELEEIVKVQDVINNPKSTIGEATEKIQLLRHLIEEAQGMEGNQAFSSLIERCGAAVDAQRFIVEPQTRFLTLKSLEEWSVQEVSEKLPDISTLEEAAQLLHANELLGKLIDELLLGIRAQNINLGLNRAYSNYEQRGNPEALSVVNKFLKRKEAEINAFEKKDPKAYANRLDALAYVCWYNDKNMTKWESREKECFNALKELAKKGGVEKIRDHRAEKQKLMDDLDRNLNKATNDKEVEQYWEEYFEKLDALTKEITAATA